MEESTNLHHLHLHLHLQDVQPPGPVEASNSLASPSCYGSGSWIPNISNLNAGSFNNPNLPDGDPRSRALTQKNDIGVLPRPLNGSMIQDLGYNHHQWTTSDSESCLTTNPSSTHDLDLQFSKIKDEISDRDTGFPKFTQMLNSSSSMKNNNEHKDMNALNNLNEKLLLKTLYSGGDFYSSSTSIQNNYPSFGGGGGGVGVPSRGSFSQIYPSINISNLNHSSNSPPPTISSSSSLDIMSTQSLDLLTSTTTFGSQGHDLGRFTDNLSFRLQHHLQQSTDRSSGNNNNRNTPHFANGMAETKRASTLMEKSMASQSQTASKKSRLDSCPPLKVRKEKLGDRIAALQQLVAPFGKTDTASVLMEAIGYIKFLQSQVETLSVPYMKSSQKHNNRVMQGGSGIGDTNEESKQDLRSRGLCLVPLSCMSYIAGDGGCGVWQQPDGAT